MNEDQYREATIRDRKREDEMERIRYGMPSMKQVDDFIEQYMLKHSEKSDTMTGYNDTM